MATDDRRTGKTHGSTQGSDLVWIHAAVDEVPRLQQLILVQRHPFSDVAANAWRKTVVRDETSLDLDRRINARVSDVDMRWKVVGVDAE